MKRLFTVLLALFMAVSLSFWAALPVGAQEEEEDEDVFQLEEVTVTAEKREANIQDVARSVVAITAEDLDMRSATQVAEIIENTAGISFVAGGGWLNHIGMRGVIGNTREDGSESAVMFSVDGMSALSAGESSISPMYSAMMDIERIEVIRGPSGSVSGRMASAGSIQVITKAPDFEKYDGYVGYTIGNYGTYSYKAALNVPIGLTGLELPSFLENIATRFAITQDKHGNYIENSAGEGVRGNVDAITWRAKLAWAPIEALKFDYQLNYSREKSDNGMSIPISSSDWIDPNSPAASEPSEREQYAEQYNLALTTRFANLNAKGGRSWQPIKCDANSPPWCVEGDKDQLEWEIYASNPNSSDIKWNVGTNIFNKTEFAGPESQIGVVDLSTTQIRMTEFYGGAGGPPGSGNLFEQAGYSINDASQNLLDPNTTGWIDEVYPGGELYGGPVDENSIYYYSTSATRPIDSYSFYGNLTIPLFGGDHRVSGGLRMSKEEKKREVTFAVIGTDVPGDVPHFTWVYDGQSMVNGVVTGEPSTNPDGTQTTRGNWVADNFNTIYLEQDPTTYNTDDSVYQYSLGYEYDLRDDVMFYINYNTGFTPGGVSVTAIPNTFYDPAISTNYAVGMKSRWLDNRLQLNVEAYLMNYDGYQINIAGEGILANDLAIDGSNGVVDPAVADYLTANANADGTFTFIQPYRFQSKRMNMGDTNNYGIELDYDWLITSRDRIKGNMEFKNAEYGELDLDRGATANPPGSARYVSYGGMVMQNSPKFVFFTSYSHTFSLSNLMIVPTIDAKYSTKYFCNSEPWWESLAGDEIWQDPYWKFNAYVNIQPTDGAWSLNLYGKNLTETEVKNLVGWSKNLESPPRLFGATLTVNF